MAAKGIEHPTIDERRARGAKARASTPPSSHAKWRPAADRPDPVALLEEQNVTREPDLVPCGPSPVPSRAPDKTPAFCGDLSVISVPPEF